MSEGDTADLPPFSVQRGTVLAVCAHLQLREPLTAAGAALEDRRFTVDQLAAAAGEDAWPIDQVRSLLLAAPDRELPNAATVWKPGAADRLAVLASRVGEPTTGSDFRDERGRAAAKCRKHGLKEGRLRFLRFSRGAQVAPSVAHRSS